MIITCKVCLENLYPEDPRVRTGRYHMNSCDYCEKSTYDREIEAMIMEPHRETKVTSRMHISLKVDAHSQYLNRRLTSLESIVKDLDKSKTKHYNDYT